MSNRAQRRAQAAASRHVPTSVSTHHKFVKGQSRLTALTNDIRRLQLDADDKVEELLNGMAGVVHEMAKSDKMGIHALADAASRAMKEIMTDKVRASLIQLKWKTATMETIDDFSMDEIVRRSMIRSDLALALCMTDRMALVADAARKRGEDPTAAAHAFYAKALGVEQSREMRERLVQMHWRGANADTLEDLAVGGVLDNLDRCVQLATQFSVLEDIDKPPGAEEGFERRLDDEYNQTLWSGDSATLMYQIVQRQARAHYEEFKDRVGTMDDEELRDLADRTEMVGDWATVKPTILKLGWKGASNRTIDAMFMDAVFREIRTMAQIEARRPSPPPNYFGDQPGITAGHLLCLEHILANIAEMPKPIPKLSVILGVEVGDGTVSVSQHDHDGAVAMATALPETQRILHAGLGKAAAIEAKRPRDTADDPIAVVLATDASGTIVTTCIEFDALGVPLPPPAPPIKTNQWKPSKGPKFYASTFDRALMRLGRKLWEEAYAKGLAEGIKDGKVHMTFIEDKTDVDPLLGRFSVLWAVHAFQRLTTSHTYAAALMCSDADRESLATIQDQWSAFLVMVPNGMLRTDSFLTGGPTIEFTRILVALFEGRAELSMLDFSGPGGVAHVTLTVDAPTLGELLAPDNNTAPTVIRADAPSEPADNARDVAGQIMRAITMGKRLVAGLLLSMQNTEAVKTREVAYKAGRPGRDESEPAHRMVIVGQPIKIDCREAIETFIRTGRGSRGGGGGLKKVQWIVRGHWRQQVYGVGRLGRKSIWIKPHWAGRPDAPILSRPKLVT